ncbi:DUF4241 domain-containing protein [Streptomyces longispororuber]|uniref:DUF4241 domain-containing protein n=1 Tax=Streptomyces longispororuber TaxID=68230 RepID=UPI00210A8C56|nr:DUF4241 domain-containing protein [Streptomyces longispororuber]MCQ4213531.1 DUF4241 domain-containing protein [Streptomyces longispororuber]
MSQQGWIDVTYGLGHDAASGTVTGRMTREAAAALDAAGEPYTVVLREGDRAEAIVVHVAWAAHHLGMWLYDRRRRRFMEVDLRRITDDRLFLLHQRMWHYTDDDMAEGSPEAGRVTIDLMPGGRGRKVVEPKGERGGSTHTVADVPEHQRWLPVPEFGDYRGLLGLLGFGEEATAAEFRDVPVDGNEAATTADLDAAPDWRPPAPLRPRHLDALFTPGTRFSGPSHAREETYLVRRPVPAGTLHLPTGRLVARDPSYGECEQDAGFTVPVPPGSYPVQIAAAGYVTEHWGKTLDIDEYTAARVVISERPTVEWESALLPDQDVRLLQDGHFYGFGVDGGTGAFVDASAAEALAKQYWTRLTSGTAAEDDHGITELTDPSRGPANLIAYPSGMGDGSYPVWIGRDAGGEVTCFVADMLILHGSEMSA